MKTSTHSILIIDDEPENLNALERTLRPVANVLKAESGKSGQALLKKNAVSLIICDQRMPEMTGIEFFKQIRDTYPDIIRIILTGYTDIEDLIEAINEVGLYRYITKPWNNHELQLVVKRALEHYELLVNNKVLVQELKKINETLEKTVIHRTQQLKDANILLKKLSVTDELTQIGNPRFIKDQLKSELERSKRYKHNLSILLIDIDYFKKYNDALGHAVGDKALKTVAQTLKKNIRNTDILARFGGEEFMILLPETPKTQALEMAERLRRAVMQKKFSYKFKGKRGGLTISIGVSSYPTDKMKSETRLLLKADKALYKAKRKGRNKVESS